MMLSSNCRLLKKRRVAAASREVSRIRGFRSLSLGGFVSGKPPDCCENVKAPVQLTEKSPSLAIVPNRGIQWRASGDYWLVRMPSVYVFLKESGLKQVTNSNDVSPKQLHA